MPFHFTGNTRPNRPYFGHDRQDVSIRPNFPWTSPRPRPMNPNKYAQFKRYQQNSNNPDQHWCETCDRGFNTLQQLEGHKQQHQKCNIDGCKFVAHPKVITKHIQMQHSSGLYKRISKLDNPEEIKKWIEERKKKYPTKVNIEKKSAEIKEKIERGEKMGLRQERFQRNNSQGGMKRNNNYNRNNGNFDNPQVKRHARLNNIDKSNKMKSKKVMPPKNVKVLPSIDDTRKLKPFTGILNIDMDMDSNEEIEQIECNFEIVDDETVIEHKESKLASEPIVCGALTSLMCSYVSSDEENNVVNKVNSCNENTRNCIGNTTKETKIEIKNETSIPPTEENKSDDDSGPEETKVVKSVEGPIISSESADANSEAKKQTNTKRNSNLQIKKRTFTRPKPKVPSTLLHKLLQNEVRHERNVILQCVRYIVNNKYFDY